MHGGHFAETGISHVDVEGLRLINEWGSANSEIYNLSLRNFPDCLVKFFDMLRNFRYLLNGAIKRKKLVFNFRSPQV